jgi:hypothetical protein
MGDSLPPGYPIVLFVSMGMVDRQPLTVGIYRLTVGIFPKTILDHDISIVITAVDRQVITPACKLIFKSIGNIIPKDPEDKPLSQSCVNPAFDSLGRAPLETLFLEWLQALTMPRQIIMFSRCHYHSYFPSQSLASTLRANPRSCSDPVLVGVIRECRA